MAKKKATSATKTRTTKSSKTTTRKPSSSKKAAPKRDIAKASKPKSSPKSVDGILKAFEKERVNQNSNLISIRKKIEQLTKKVSSLKTELEGLKKTAVETEIAIETLDARRDKEIGTLLTSMGIDLGKAAAASKPKPQVELSTPLFDDNSATKKKTDKAAAKA
jgi:hypothetical protein